LLTQWKAPQNLSSWIQRAERAARGPGTNGMAVMLVEKSEFKVSPFGGEAVDHSASTSESVRGRGWGRGKATCGRGGNRGRGGGNALGKDYAESHGQKRGSYRGTDNSIPHWMLRIRLQRSPRMCRQRDSMC
ncbi:hypothetical protein B0H14DRAFT_2390472, partial [Mycena olivaceomarginata]